jgi:hypothetical protein
MWSRYFSGRSVALEMHLLTKHVGAQMLLFAALDEKMEVTVEKNRNLYKLSNILWVAINNCRFLG